MLSNLPSLRGKSQACAQPLVRWTAGGPGDLVRDITLKFHLLKPFVEVFSFISKNYDN